jgi:c(7)-type cytochrome triheme protein
MRASILLLILLSSVVVVPPAAGGKKPPAKIVFPTKAGDVIFVHAAHIKREKRNCPVCHDKLWSQSTATPLKSSDGCKTCHHADGAAFEMKGNCAKCHGSGGAKIAASAQLR